MSTSDSIFVYGTLQCPEVLHILIDRVPQQQPATISQWRVAPLPNDPYPGLIPDPVSTAQGLVLSGLTEKEMQLFDHFEGDQYQRVTVTIPKIGELSTYRLTDPNKASLGVWNVTEFRAIYLREYEEKCLFWRRQYDQGFTMSQQTG